MQSQYSFPSFILSFLSSSSSFFFLMESQWPQSHCILKDDPELLVLLLLPLRFCNHRWGPIYPAAIFFSDHSWHHKIEMRWWLGRWGHGYHTAWVQTAWVPWGCSLVLSAREGPCVAFMQSPLRYIHYLGSEESESLAKFIREISELSHRLTGWHALGPEERLRHTSTEIKSIAGRRYWASEHSCACCSWENTVAVKEFCKYYDKTKSQGVSSFKS